MPLISCPDCSKQISDSAPSCIHCGRQLGPPPAPAARPVDAQAVKEGQQRAKLRNDLGGGIALVTLIVGGFLAIAVHPLAGLVAIIAGLIGAAWVAYGW